LTQKKVPRPSNPHRYIFKMRFCFDY